MESSPINFFTSNTPIQNQRTLKLVKICQIYPKDRFFLGHPVAPKYCIKSCFKSGGGKADIICYNNMKLESKVQQTWSKIKIYNTNWLNAFKTIKIKFIFENNIYHNKSYRSRREDQLLGPNPFLIETRNTITIQHSSTIKGISIARIHKYSEK